MIQPPSLKPGDKIAIVSIARKVIPSQIHTAIEIFESWGFQVVVGDYAYSTHNQFGGTDEERAMDLQKVLDDSEIKAIISSRGGYGTSRIIDLVDFSVLYQFPKWIIGFSDITLLLNHLYKLNISSLHATMPVLFGNEDAAMSLSTLQKSLRGEDYSVEAAYHPFNRSGTAAGELIGGNLSLLVHMIGTSSEVDYDGKILFIEDIDEYLYHIDRMMIQLKRAGKLKNLAGLVVGYFSDMRDNQVPFGKTAFEIIAEHVEDYSYPIAFGIPAGHEHPNYCLPFGIKSHLFVNENNCSIKFSFEHPPVQE